MLCLTLCPPLSYTLPLTFITLSLTLRFTYCFTVCCQLAFSVSEINWLVSVEIKWIQVWQQRKLRGPDDDEWYTQWFCWSVSHGFKQLLQYNTKKHTNDTLPGWWPDCCLPHSTDTNNTSQMQQAFKSRGKTVTQRSGTGQGQVRDRESQHTQEMKAVDIAERLAYILTRSPSLSV